MDSIWTRPKSVVGDGEYPFRALWTCPFCGKVSHYRFTTEYGVPEGMLHVGCEHLVDLQVVIPFADEGREGIFVLFSKKEVNEEDDGILWGPVVEGAL